MSERLFCDRAVIKVVETILRSKGIRQKQDLEDAVQTVLLRCIERVSETARPPVDVPGAIAFARPVAENLGVDEVRKRSRRGARNQGLTDQADEHAHEPRRSVDPVDEGRMLGVIREVLNDKQIEGVYAAAAGTPHAELAAERGVSTAAARKDSQRSRDRALAALRARGYVVAGGFGALLASMAAIWIRSGDDDRVMAPRNDWDIAEEMRDEAAHACGEGRWDDCEKLLDEAGPLDPEGELELDVRALRGEIAAARRARGAGAGAGKSPQGSQRPTAPQ